MSSIDWRELGQDPRRVEDLLAALIIDTHPGAAHIDGSGGDGGRDVIWDSPDGLVIFEIMSVNDRLHPHQKRQIKGSLTKALTHGPVRWVLVIPLKHSPAEEALPRTCPAGTRSWRTGNPMTPDPAGLVTLARHDAGERSTRRPERPRAGRSGVRCPVATRHRTLVTSKVPCCHHVVGGAQSVS